MPEMVQAETVESWPLAPNARSFWDERENIVQEREKNTSGRIEGSDVNKKSDAENKDSSQPTSRPCRIFVS